MSNNHVSTNTPLINYKRILIILIVTLVGITAIYQTRPFLDDAQFAWISVPAFTILPGVLAVYSAILTVKLFKQKHYQTKAFFLFTTASVFWVIAEVIWLSYDHIWDGEPFPSEADIFYLGAYPFLTAFLLISLKLF